MSTIGAAGRALFFWREAVATRSGRHCIIGTKSIISSASPVGTNFVTDIQGTAASMSIATAHKIEEGDTPRARRSEEQTSELQSLMRRSYAVFCVKKKT